MSCFVIAAFNSAETSLSNIYVFGCTPACVKFLFNFVHAAVICVAVLVGVINYFTMNL